MTSQNKTGLIKKRIVCYIQDHALRPGDQLPPIEYFRALFDCGTTTVARAINELRSEGAVRVQNRVGVFVADPYIGGNAGRVIGISIYSPLALYGSSDLLSSLEFEISRCGCSSRLFLRPLDLPDQRYEFSFRDFPGLERAVKNHSIDALINLGKFDCESLDFLHKNNMPELFIGYLARGNKNCVVCDFEDVLLDMCRTAAFQNCRRPAALFPKSAMAVLKEVLIREAGDRAYMLWDLPQMDSESVAPLIAEKILAMPEEERPDLLIIFNDGVANGLLFHLAIRLPQEKLPAALVLVNRHGGIIFPPMPCLKKWEIDKLNLACNAVRILLEFLRGGREHINCVKTEFNTL